MMLYHGSTLAVPKPDIVHSRARVDFGPGFYTTTLYDQAIKWCQRFKTNGQDAIVNSYICDDEAYASFKVLTFESYTEEWLDFVLACRKGEDSTDYDIVAGGVANDRVFNTVELFFEGLITKQEALGRLRFEQPNWQVCFRTQKAIDACLSFVHGEKL